MIRYLPGIGFSFFIALLAHFLSALSLFAIIGPPVIALLIGLLLSKISNHSSLKLGYQFVIKRILKISVILLGFQFNLALLFQTGFEFVLIILFSMTVLALFSYVTRNIFKLDPHLLTLITSGTAICGGTAIATLAPVIDAQEDQVAYSLSTIFLFSMLAVLIYPIVGNFFSLSDFHFGIWAGASINDTSSVVAASSFYGDMSGSIATIVKLTRVIMLIPLVIILSIFTSKKNKIEKVQLKKIFPWFVIGFLIASLLSTQTYIHHSIVQILINLGKFFIVWVMGAIGLSTDWNALLKNGIRPLFFGFCCSLILSLSTLLGYYLIFN